MTETAADPRAAPAFTIAFPNGNMALATHAVARAPVGTLLANLGISGPRPVLLVIGGADGLPGAAEPALRDLMGSGALVAAEAEGAVVVDGGTSAGIIAIVGEAAAAAHMQLTLLGVAPAGRVTWPGDTRPGASNATALEPDHTHFILADGDAWGDETPLLFEVVEAMGDPSNVVALVAGGGAITRREIESAVNRGIPIIAISGTGGLADELAAAVAVGGPATPTASDPGLRSILGGIDLAVLPLDAAPALLERTLLRRLRPDESLRSALRQYRMLAHAARQERRSFVRYQLVIPALGLLVTTLVVIQAQLRNAGSLVEGTIQDQGFQYLIVLIPIAIGVLVAGAARLRPGGRWVLLRGAAEAIKSQLYRYRTRTGVYSAASTRRTPREVKLATVVGATMQSLMLTDVNLSALDPATASGSNSTALAKMDVDDGMRPLGPDEYIRVRIDDQIGFYRRGVLTRERRVRSLRWLTLGFGGLGTFLAVVGLQLWVAVAVALVGAVTTWIEAMQLDATITLYNQAATNLETIKAWWTALPPIEQMRRRNVDRLVERSERVMQAEHAGWVQEMQDAMTRLRLEREEGPVDGVPRNDGSAADATDPADT